MIKIATLIVVYNGDKLENFKVAIDSIFRQTIAGAVINNIYLAINGSINNEFCKYIDSIRPELYHVEYIEFNKGLAFALNSLINKLGDEKYVFRMDSDDISDSRRYEMQLNYMISNDIDILGSSIIEFDDNNGECRIVRYPVVFDNIARYLAYATPVAHPTVCFKRIVLNSIGGYPVEGSNEDIALWFKCAKYGFKFGNIHSPLLRFRVNTSFYKRRSFNKAFNEFKVYVCGIYSLNGYTLLFIFPFLRLLYRMMPIPISRLIYRLRVRKILLS